VRRALGATADYFTASQGERCRRLSFSHPLAINEAARNRFNVGPFERAGYAETVMSMSGRRPDAVVGASFSAIFDAANWDRSNRAEPSRPVGAIGQSSLCRFLPSCGGRTKLFPAGFQRQGSRRECALDADAGAAQIESTYDGFWKLTFGTCVASGGAWKNGYSLNPNTFAVRLAGKLLRRGVVFLDPLVVTLPLHGDAILRAGELVHQAVELSVRLELRIIFRDRQQPAQRARLLVLRPGWSLREFSPPAVYEIASRRCL